VAVMVAGFDESLVTQLSLNKKATHVIKLLHRAFIIGV
jgi:hypothetical protein